jgi:hypothetical protein
MNVNTIEKSNVPNKPKKGNTVHSNMQIKYTLLKYRSDGRIDSPIK